MKPNFNYLLSFFILMLFVSTTSIAQSETSILVITNLNTKIILDGLEQGQAKAGTPLKLNTMPGEHYIEAQAFVDGVAKSKGEVTLVEAGKQKIIKINFETDQPGPASEIIPVTEVTFNLPGSVEVIAWQDKNPGKNYPHPEIFYAFEKGDEIIINVSMAKNKNGTNIIEVATYPEGIIKYTNRDFTELKDLKIPVEERSIYRFTLATNYAFAYNALVKISRKPATPAVAGFNTNVSRQKIYKLALIANPTLLTINSGNSTTRKNEKSRVVFPINLPPNTTEWYYRFSVSRNPDLIKNVQENFRLYDELTKAFSKISETGALTGNAIEMAVKNLTTPPGSDYCDIYLLKHNNISNFEAKNDGAWKSIPQGTRKNQMSGNIKIDCCNSGQYYLGIKNPDATKGINVSIEVLAITVTENYVMETK